MHYSITQDKNQAFVVSINEEEMTFSTFEDVYEYIRSIDNEATFIRDDKVNAHDEMLNALFEFDGMSRTEMRVIHARSHSRRNAYRGCAYCVRDFIDGTKVGDEEQETFARAINSRMSHANCDHDNSKNARAKCRRARRNAQVNA